MATTVTPPPVIAVPGAVPGVAPATSSPPLASAPARGWLTSEHALQVLAIVVAALLNANVLPSGSEASKLVLMAGAILSSLGYTAARTVLKAAAAKVANDNAPFASLANTISSVVAGAGRAAGILLVAGALALCASSLTACKSLGGATPGEGSGSASSGSGFGACSLANLEAAAGSKTLLGAVAVDLVSGNYEAALAALAVDVGVNEVNCAVVAFADLEGALEAASAAAPSDGSAKKTSELAQSPALANANVYIQKHGLRAAAGL